MIQAVEFADYRQAQQVLPALLQRDQPDRLIECVAVLCRQIMQTNYTGKLCRLIEQVDSVGKQLRPGAASGR
jgi:hypothetical protein